MMPGRVVRTLGHLLDGDQKIVPDLHGRERVPEPYAGLWEQDVVWNQEASYRGLRTKTRKKKFQKASRGSPLKISSISSLNTSIFQCNDHLSL